MAMIINLGFWRDGRNGVEDVFNHNSTAGCTNFLRLRRRNNDKVSGANNDSETLKSAARITGAKAGNVKPTAPKEPVWSSGVPFYPPSNKYWRIGNRWYDLEPFLHKHPGGSQVLLLSRDRFEDATFVFEAHHHDYSRVRKILNKYRVPDDRVPASSISARPPRGQPVHPRTHFDSDLDRGRTPGLLGDDAFYSDLRRRVDDHLASAGCPAGQPTWTCLILFWINFALWLASISAAWWTGRLYFAVTTAIVGAWLGGFGHNWVHQPKYKAMGFALLSLDTVGFSSEAWFRDHLLQHHMYTNTPWDNHFKGTDPFLVTDPTVERNWVQRSIFPYVNLIILCFGVYGNYTKHLIDMCHGLEVVSIGKMFLPLQFYFMISRWGLLHGGTIMFVTHSILGMYYFTIALMNHNGEEVLNMSKRNASKDWAIAQLNSCTDWCVNLPFFQAGIFLWLNYHTVHHLFPRVDMSHHPAIQQILIRTCKEHGVEYHTSTPGRIYKEMVKSFSTPHSLFQEVFVYSGG